MNALEKHPEFDKSIKSELKAASGAPKVKTKKQPSASGGSGGDDAGGATGGGGVEDDGEDSFGLGLFAAAEKEGLSKPKVGKYIEVIIIFIIIYNWSLSVGQVIIIIKILILQFAVCG